MIGLLKSNCVSTIVNTFEISIRQSDQIHRYSVKSLLLIQFKSQSQIIIIIEALR